VKISNTSSLQEPGEMFLHETGLPTSNIIPAVHENISLCTSTVLVLSP